MFRTIIADDEPLARARLERLLAKNEAIEIVGVAENGNQALELINQHHPDLLVLDINMPLKTGLEVAKEVQNSLLRAPAIIFTTAYDDFALEAFNVDAADYLMKPIHEEDLSKAIKKASRLNKLQAQEVTDFEHNVSTLLLKRSAQIERVPIANILYFQARDKLVIAGLVDAEEIIVDYSLKELEQQLSGAFCRIHRNTLVNNAYLEKMERDDSGHYVLHLAGMEKHFDVSRRQVTVLKSHFERIS